MSVRRIGSFLYDEILAIALGGVDGLAEAVPVGCLIDALLQGEAGLHRQSVALLGNGTFEVGCLSAEAILTWFSCQLVARGQTERFVQFHQTRTAVLETILTCLQTGVDAQVGHHLRIEVVQHERLEDHPAAVARQGIAGYLVAEGDADGCLLIVLRVAAVVHAEEACLGRNVQQLALHRVLPLALEAGGEDAAYVAVALSFGFDGEAAFQCTVGGEAVVGVDADVVVLGSGDGCQAEVGAFGRDCSTARGRRVPTWGREASACRPSVVPRPRSG